MGLGHIGSKTSLLFKNPDNISNEAILFPLQNKISKILQKQNYVKTDDIIPIYYEFFDNSNNLSKKNQKYC